MKLQLKEVAPYLPYKLKVKSINIFKGNPIFEMGTETKGGGSDIAGIKWILEDNFKLILRPLSDVYKEIELNGKKFVPQEILDETQMPHWTYGNIKYLDSEMLKDAPFWFVQKLIEWHFDICELIPQGKAIDINTLNK